MLDKAARGFTGVKAVLFEDILFSVRSKGFANPHSRFPRRMSADP